MIPQPDIYEPLLKVIEFLGTFAFAISGIRHAAAKHFDWLGGFVCGIAVAIGGGTIRDAWCDTILDDIVNIYNMYGACPSVCHRFRSFAP